MNYDQLADRALSGGFTVSLTGYEPTTGYVVSNRPGAETVLAIRPTTTRRDVADAIYAYVVDHGRELRGEHLLGAWRDGDRLYLDLVMVTQDREHALQVAELAGQLAIWDLDNGEEVRL